MTTVATPEGMSIREAARASGLSEDTLRWYERIGLTPHVERASSGHRRFGPRDLQWLAFISRLRLTGMSIESLLRYSRLAREGDATIPERRTMLVEHQTRIEQRMVELQETLDGVKWKIAHYDEFADIGNRALLESGCGIAP